MCRGEALATMWHGAVITAAYPCVLAHKIFVASKAQGGLEEPAVLMKYGHFYTGARSALVYVCMSVCMHACVCARACVCVCM